MQCYAIDVQTLKDKQNQFGKLIARTMYDEPITTYGYIRSINGKSIVFEDSGEECLVYRVKEIQSFELEEFKPKHNKL